MVHRKQQSNISRKVVGITRLILSLTCLLANTLVAAERAPDSYCLSGGGKSGYGCNVVDGGWPATREKFAIQVLVANDDNVVNDRIGYPLLHQIVVTETQRLMYFGGIDDLSHARKVFASVEAELDSRYRPALVSYIDRQPMPLIHLVDGVNPRAAVALINTSAAPSANVVSAAIAPVVEPVADTAFPSVSASGSESTITPVSHYATVYTIQVGAFESVDFAQRFSELHKDIPLQCRRKKNNLIAAYYGVFENRADASEHLQDYPLLSARGAYVLRLDDVSMSPCGALAEAIEATRQSAYGERGCGGSSACDIKELTRDLLPGGAR